jgi:hypothetical protein
LKATGQIQLAQPQLQLVVQKVSLQPELCHSEAVVSSLISVDTKEAAYRFGIEAFVFAPASFTKHVNLDRFAAFPREDCLFLANRSQAKIAF